MKKNLINESYNSTLSNFLMNEYIDDCFESNLKVLNERIENATTIAEIVDLVNQMKDVKEKYIQKKYRKQ